MMMRAAGFETQIGIEKGVNSGFTGSMGPGLYSQRPGCLAIVSIR